MLTITAEVNQNILRESANNVLKELKKSVLHESNVYATDKYFVVLFNSKYCKEGQYDLSTHVATVKADLNCYYYFEVTFENWDGKDSIVPIPYVRGLNRAIKNCLNIDATFKAEYHQTFLDEDNDICTSQTVRIGKRSSEKLLESIRNI